LPFAIYFPSLPAILPAILSIVVWALPYLYLSVHFSPHLAPAKNAGEKRRQIALSTTYVTNVAVGTDNSSNSTAATWPLWVSNGFVQGAYQWIPSCPACQLIMT